MFERNKVKEFLRKHKQLEETINQDEFVSKFISRMEEGLKESGKLLAMEPSHLYNNLNHPSESEKVLVLDAGGTHFRVSHASYKNGVAIFNNNEKSKIPGVGKKINKDEFYSQIADKCKNHIKDIKKVGYCFSYPIDIGSNLDGKVIRMGKEIYIDGIEGSFVGAETLKHLKKYEDINPKITLFNDTIAALYGGISDLNKQGNYIGYIFGTGLNVAYFEKSNKVTKCNDLVKNMDVSVNIEAAYFDEIPYGDFEDEYLKEVGSVSALEKCTSGVYFSHILTKAFNAAKKENLVSFDIPNDLILKDYSDFLDGSKARLNHVINNHKDLIISRLILDEMIKRNAKLGSSAVAASIVKNVNQYFPIYVIAEGSTFKGLPGYEKYFKKYLNGFLKKKGLKAIVYTGDNLTLKGSLLIALNS